MVGSPAALHLVGGGHRGGAEDVGHGGLDQPEDFGEIRLSLQDQVEAGLASHRREVDDLGGMVAGVFREEVLDRVHCRHLQVRGVGLGEAHVILHDDVALRKGLGVRQAHVGCLDGAVVEVERLDVHAGLIHAISSGSGAPATDSLRDSLCGPYWARTDDIHGVNVALYQLS